MKRGEVGFINLDPTVGAEIRQRALQFSGSAPNRRLGTAQYAGVPFNRSNSRGIRCRTGEAD